MDPRYDTMARTDVEIDASAEIGPFEGWRHALGQGGINRAPLPPRVVAGVRNLHPRLVRVFIQEFFAVYPEHGRYDWQHLDPYMEALAATGATVVAAICIKPKVLFPEVDQARCEPTDTAEWQELIRRMVHRYSVERRIVTHWEVGNETDIGEDGGTPQLIPHPDDYFRFYKTVTAAVLEAFPQAKVGGPAACWIDNEPLPGLIKRCLAEGIPLDFISWHCYNDNPGRHAAGVRRAKELVAAFPTEKRPELMVTEWSKGFDAVSVADQAFEPRRAAAVAASALAMTEAGVDWTYYYHIQDQPVDPEQFAPFFSDRGTRHMVRHWNEVPHRFGLFGVDEEVRPQYFVYWMLHQLGERRVACQIADSDLVGVATRATVDGAAGVAERGAGEKLAGLLCNYSLQSGRDLLVNLRLRGLASGRRQLSVFRIDQERRWSDERFELLPLERRSVYTLDPFAFQVVCPADTVVLWTIE